MRHVVELKMPKLFGRKKAIDETEVRTEIDLEDGDKAVPAVLVIAVPLVVGLGIGYLVGYKAGTNKGGTNVIVVKG